MVSQNISLQEVQGVEYPTVWGMDPVELHDRFWASRGVQVVRQGLRSQIVLQAELFLLTDPRSLVVFQIGRLVDRLSWLHPDLMWVRLSATRDLGYLERVVEDAEGRFVRWERVYTSSDARMRRVALTSSRDVAERWQNAAAPHEGWRRLRRHIPRSRQAVMRVDGSVYDRTNPNDLAELVRDLVQNWRTPDATISRARPLGSGCWIDVDAKSRVNGDVRLMGSVWIGAGRTPPKGLVVGPAVLWDDPAHRPQVRDIEWWDIEPSEPLARRVVPSKTSSVGRLSKRLFDIGFALLALLITAPIYPLVMLAIWIEDGSPFFFTHKRETLGGTEFPCIKFRSMRNDSEQIKADLTTRNLADGPQFFIDPDVDPRLTRVGRLIRKLNIDELPQFINVLLGHMSVVGPRPSPRVENQFSPPWREARLSVRPGITGLWQVMRTRQEGLDFQEWVKYDIRYVERQSWRLDLFVIWRTILILLKLK